MIIPPPKNATLSPQSARDPTVRDRHIANICAHGRMAWQKSTGYNKRSRVETLMGRWKNVIGPKLKARHFDNQKTEVCSATTKKRTQQRQRQHQPTRKNPNSQISRRLKTGFKTGNVVVATGQGGCRPTEVSIGVTVLNKMTELGRPGFARVS